MASYVTDNLYHGLQTETVKQCHPLVRLFIRLTECTRKTVLYRFNIFFSTRDEGCFFSI